MDLTHHWAGLTALVLFVLAYIAVVLEEFTHLRKSKPVILAAGLIWALVGYQYARAGLNTAAEEAIGGFLLEFAELFLFLLSAMTYVNTMSERNVFDALKGWLANRGFSYRGVFWITGFLSFFISPVLDNLTTALVMSGVVLAVDRGNKRFVTLACINIVVAANAGGAFSPFGDITTLMVWQRGIVEFHAFFHLFLPALVNYVVPAFFMSLAIPNMPTGATKEKIPMKRGAKRILFLFACTVATAVTFHNFLDLPAFRGMMTGLAALMIFGYFLRLTHEPLPPGSEEDATIGEVDVHYDSYREVARIEWDTLLFFFGVIMCVGGLSFVGYLELMSQYFYGDLGPTVANVLVGIVSAIVDNIPIMVSVLEMNPTMDTEQWLLVALTAGVGGSILSIGSAAGVALMGQARGVYTFFAHLRWAPLIALGYFASVAVHLLINGNV